MNPIERPGALPSFVKNVVGDIEPGYWKPQNLSEWSEIQKTTVFLDAWVQQQQQERSLRKMIGIWVFILITLQILSVPAFVFLDAVKFITLNTEIVKFLIPSILGEVFGMGFVVVKYLFTPSDWNLLSNRTRK